MGSYYTSLAVRTLLLTVISGLAHAADRHADPAVWGVYAQLVGTEWKASFRRSRIVAWGDGERMTITSTAIAAHEVSIIEPAGAGRLKLTVPRDPKILWTGEIGPGGTVLWKSVSGLGIPFRYSLEGNVLTVSKVTLHSDGSSSMHESIKYKGTPTLASATPVRNSPDLTPSADVEQLAEPQNAMTDSMQVAAHEELAQSQSDAETTSHAFGDIESVVDQHLVSDWHDLEVSITPNRDLAIEYIYPQHRARYVLRSTEVPGKFKVIEHVCNGYHRENSFSAWLQKDGSLAIKFRNKGLRDSAPFWVEVFRIEADELIVSSFGEYKDGSRESIGEPDVYQPANAERIKLASQHRAASAARDRALKREREDAQFEARQAAYRSALDDFSRTVEETYRDTSAQPAVDSARLQGDATRSAAPDGERSSPTAAGSTAPVALNSRPASAQQGVDKVGLRTASASTGAVHARGTRNQPTPGNELKAQTSGIAGSASTEDDASSCVTPPVLHPNKACGKGQGARITNQCSYTVRARICLKIDGRWDCGATFGIEPGDSWSWGSCSVPQEVFHSVLSANSKRKHADPPGS